MRKWPFVLVLVCLLLGSGVVSAGDAPAKARQFQIDLSVRQGDPLGSPEAGSLEVLAERKLITSEKQAAKFVQGAEETIGDEVIRIGRTIRVTPERAEKGQIRLDVVMEKTDLLEESEDTAQWQTTQSRYTRWLKPGQVLKLRWGKVSGQQTWVELTVCEVGQ
jgi:hypothetical protein